MEVIQVDLTIQAETFVVLAVTGALLGFLFDFYRVLRGIHKPRSIMTYLSDLVYWLIATVIAGGALLYSNWGEMRLYVVIALLTGAWGYFKFLSRAAIRLVISVIRWMETAVRWIKLAIYYLVIKPISYPVRLVAVPLSYCARKIRNLSRFFETKEEEPPI